MSFRDNTLPIPARLLLCTNDRLTIVGTDTADFETYYVNERRSTSAVNGAFEIDDPTVTVQLRRCVIAARNPGAAAAALTIALAQHGPPLFTFHTVSVRIAAGQCLTLDLALDGLVIHQTKSRPHGGGFFGGGASGITVPQLDVTSDVAGVHLDVTYSGTF